MDGVRGAIAQGGMYVRRSSGPTTELAMLPLSHPHMQLAAAAAAPREKTSTHEGTGTASTNPHAHPLLSPVPLPAIALCSLCVRIVRICRPCLSSVRHTTLSRSNHYVCSPAPHLTVSRQPSLHLQPEQLPCAVQSNIRSRAAAMSTTDSASSDSGSDPL